MVELDRAGVVEPKGWQERVEKALVDHAAYTRRAQAFERLPLSSKIRRQGFKAYARRMLVKCGGDLPAVWRKSKALKKALAAMTDEHCAYCQKGIEKGHVEHVLPKSLFPLLAYVVHNYIHACARCNEAKSNNWPNRGRFIRPDHMDPAGRFVFYDDGRVEAATADRQAKLTVEGIQLDRVGLRKLRRVVIERAMSTLLPILNMAGVPDTVRLALVRKHLVAVLSPYSEAVNQCVRRAWGARFPGVPL